jgi:hypothetical protein
MHGGKIIDALIKAVFDTTDGLKYQVDFGNDQTNNGRRAADCEGLAAEYYEPHIIKGRPFGVAFECVAQTLQKGHPL